MQMIDLQSNYFFFIKISRVSSIKYENSMYKY